MLSTHRTRRDIQQKTRQQEARHRGARRASQEALSVRKILTARLQRTRTEPVTRCGTDRAASLMQSARVLMCTNGEDAAELWTDAAAAAPPVYMQMEVGGGGEELLGCNKSKRGGQEEAGRARAGGGFPSK